MTDTTRVWFITGASRGFGHRWATAALARGDRCIATARDVTTLEPLVTAYGDAVLPIELDVTDARADHLAVDRAFAHFGRVDVLVNNAGYGLFGTVEEVTEEQARRQLDTCLFGPLWIVQAALPHLRAQGSGHIVQVSSLSGLVAIPYLGMYQAAKFGLEGYSEALAAEVAAHGIKVTIVEPGPYDTDWVYGSKEVAPENPAYEHVRAWWSEHFHATDKGGPDDLQDALLSIVDAAEPPLRVLLGEYGLPVVEAVYRQRHRSWCDWNAHVAVTAPRGFVPTESNPPPPARSSDTPDPRRC
ncbi:short-chain dehydrogenase/reductase (plasmid) [Mycolicibacterium arabiense]|uniref:Short-chain dehydrogenase/reductase n=1 Tax=Mycolicibacterium arabiense TaxID=1286181 RepID=A0A7I7RQ31_9MYCO|nr:SDR family NAD(P)-dependent oxidoreductase [Mycolicibacterium arabiense]MCV7371995.1 SDR family NAD(P)-dependent oxidoreductase [Mycolicibacterium arabiense]BBY46684.1 short-chain dehydrogenase/reductase [Mycolicibacterium arabiense]